MISVCMCDQQIDVVEKREIHVVELLERTHRTIDKDQIAIMDKKSTVMLVCECRTSAKKSKHLYSSGPIRRKISNPSALPFSLIGFSSGSYFIRPFNLSITERLT